MGVRPDHDDPGTECPSLIEMNPLQPAKCQLNFSRCWLKTDQPVWPVMHKAIISVGYNRIKSRGSFGNGTKVQSQQPTLYVTSCHFPLEMCVHENQDVFQFSVKFRGWDVESEHMTVQHKDRPQPPSILHTALSNKYNNSRDYNINNREEAGNT